MKQNKKKHLWTGIWFLLTFLLWTALIRCVDVQAAGPNVTNVGFAAFIGRRIFSALSILAVAVFIAARQPYAGILCFALLVMKTFGIMKLR